MALVDFCWYCNAGDQSTTGHYAVAKRPQNAAVAAKQLVRQFTAPAVGSERVFVCVVAGTTANVTDATWVLTRGAKTTDGTATWMECTGQAALNGDLTNTATWAQVKAATPAVLGQIIKRSNSASYQICTTAGAMSASEPAFSDTAGVTTTDTTAVWTSLGAVSNFTGGQAPHARLANACASTWFAGGNTVYVGDNHAEMQTTAISITPLTGASIGRILCHNHSGSYPPAASDLTTGATISTTTNNNINFNLSAAGEFYVYGVAFLVGVGVSTSSAFLIFSVTNSYFFFDNCVFKLAITSAGASQIQLNGSSAGVFIWNNCTVGFGSAAQYIDLGTTIFIWQNTGPVFASGSALPTSLMSASANGRLANVTLEALDLSQYTGSLFTTTGFMMKNVLMKDCKLNASMAVYASPGSPQSSGDVTQLVRCDSGATSYKSARYAYEGTETTETSITRVGGAVDPTGQAQTRKIVTTANSQWLRPFQAEPYAIWNATTGANVTVTVYGTINAGALPMNDDIWMECEYLGSATDPLGKIVTTTKSSVLASNAAVASDSSAWNNASSVSPAPVVWDAATSAGMTLSNSNRTAVRTATATAGISARTATYRSSGKFYFEFTYIAAHGSSDAVGALLSTGSISDMGNGANCACCFMNFGPGTIYSNGSNAGSLSASFTVGDVIGCALDLDNRKVWFRKNAGNWNNVAIGSSNPATNTGGFTIAAGSFTPAFVTSNTGSAAGDGHTLNAGQVTYANTAPSGFSNWLDNGVFWTPFKLVATLSSPQPQLAGYLEARVRAAKASTTFYIDPKIELT